MKKREFLPVYVLYGEETYLRDQAAKTIANLAFSEGEFRDFNDDVFSLQTSPENIRTALAAAEQLPMMAARRVVRIREVRVSTSAVKDTLKEEYEAVVANYLANPCASSIVVFLVDELNGNRKLGKLLKVQRGAVEFKTLDPSELAEWVGRTFREAETNIEPAALRRFIEFAGPSVRRLETEAGKLCTAALPERSIDVSLVETLIANERFLDDHSFAQELIEGRGAQALAALRKLLDDGSEPIAILGLIGGYYRNRLKQQDPSIESNYSRRLAHAVKRISETDLAIKTSVGGGGPAGARRQIEMLACELAAF